MEVELKTVRVLLLHDLADEAEQYVNILRNKGMATRGQLIESFEDLETNIEKKTWDLLLYKDGLTEYPLEKVLASINRFVKDIPVIVVLEEYSGDKAMQSLEDGARCVVVADQESHFALCIKRELDNLQDRRERRNMSLALLESEKRCNQLIKSSRDAVAYVAAGMHVYANARYLSFFGYSDFEDLEGVPILDLVSSSHQGEMKKFLKQYAVGLGSESSISTLIKMPDESEAKVAMLFSQATYDGEICTQLIIRLDDEDNELQSQLDKVSNQDVLTGLYNRQYLMECLRETISECRGEGNNSAFLYVKLPKFGAMQVDLGIANCDLVVNDAATNLQKLVPEGSVLAHFSDDVFAVILKSVDRKKTEDFLATLEDFFNGYLAEVQGREVPVELKVGVVLLNDSSDNPQSVIMQAYSAYESAVVHSEGQTDKSVAHFFFVREAKPADITDVDKEISSQLQQAIESGLFKVLFQPIISLRAQNQPFYEVFLRMLSSDGEEVSPSRFIEEAASQKVAEKIDRWVVVQAIKSLAGEYQEGRPTRLIINLTPQTLLDDSFVPWLGMALKASRLPHDALVFQLAENEAYRYLKEAKATCTALSELHCKVSISRFGVMASSFNIFRHVHADYVKIDGSYTKDLAGDGEKALQGLVEQVHSMGKMTIATFVEEVKVLSTLYAMGVHFIQGYYLQPPSAEMDYDFSGDDDEEEEISY